MTSKLRPILDFRPKDEAGNSGAGTSSMKTGKAQTPSFLC